MTSMTKKCPICDTINSDGTARCKTCDRPLLPPSKPAGPINIIQPQNVSQAPPSQSVGPVPPSRSVSQAPPKWKKAYIVVAVVGLLCLVLLIFLPVLLIFLPVALAIHSVSPHSPTLTSTSNGNISLPKDLGVVSLLGGQNGQVIGVNDGEFPPFDIDRLDDTDKKLAAQAWKEKNYAGALSSWDNAINAVTNDPEALIYKENMRILTSNISYITIVAGVAFSPSLPDHPSQDDEEMLQGIYVAQREFNTTNNKLAIRILIANAGPGTRYVSQVAQQVVDIAQKQKVVAVIGWLTSADTINALSVLSRANIPLISPGATSDDLNHYPTFFRIVPPNSEQAKLAASYAAIQLGASTAVVFVDKLDPYSENLSKDFEDLFQKNGKILKEEFFTSEKTDFKALIQNALTYKPDIFYFTSPSIRDTGKFEDELPPPETNSEKPYMISGNAGYVIHPKSHGRLYFTSLAFPDGWNIAFEKKIPNAFFNDYIAAFDPNKVQSAGSYDYERPSEGAILSYDATEVLLQCLSSLQKSGNTTPSSQDFLNALPQITGDNAFQGVSGQIAFGPDHDPINKTVFLLSASSDGYTQEETSIGCYIKGKCSG